MNKQKNRQKPSSSRARPVRTKIHRHLKMAVLPHKKNDYRPHLIRWQGLAFVLAIVVSVQFAYNFSLLQDVLGGKANISVEKLLSLTNKERDKSGAADLSLNNKLSIAASNKAKDMFANQYWAHTSPSGIEPWHWFIDADYRYAVAGENLAKDFTSAESIITAWMRSAEHRDNLLDEDYQDVGFAIVPGDLDGRSTMLVVALYGNPADRSVELSTEVLAARGDISPISKIGLAISTMNPAVTATLFLLMVVCLVGILSHQYRNNLPKSWRKSWRKHHGLYKAMGSASLAVAIVFLYSGGQI